MSLGIYFGPKFITVVETRGKKIVRNIHMPQPQVSSIGSEEKVSEDIKLVALFKDELRRAGISAKEAAVCLSGKDLIVRAFDLPALPARELRNAALFEAKKYIPFKVEDLFADSQIRMDRERKNQVLFVGIKKTTFEKYLSVLGQLNIKVSAVEYSAFSLLRFFQIAKSAYKDIAALISADLDEEDEINFTVTDRGVPLFSRDITLGEKAAPASVDAEAAASGIEKLKTDLRVSFDFYSRKFPSKKINRAVVVINNHFRPDLEAFFKEMGLRVNFVDPAKYMGGLSSLSLIKGYSASLYKAVRTDLRIDLVAVKAKAEKGAGRKAGKFDLAALLASLKLDFRLVFLAVLVCCAVFGLGLYRIAPVKKELAGVISGRPQVRGVNPEASYEEVNKIDSAYKAKLASADELIKKQMYLTEPFDVIPRLVPEAMWLEDFSFRREKTKEGPKGGQLLELTLKAQVYLGDSNKEFEAANKFVADLKNSPGFSKYFNQIEIVSMDVNESAKIKFTQFVVSCHSIKTK